jgi:hypothetical protein
MGVAATMALLSIGSYRFQQRKLPKWVSPLCRCGIAAAAGSGPGARGRGPQVSLLAADDASALELWRADTPLFVVLPGERAEALGQAVERFEFSQALEILRQHEAG